MSNLPATNEAKRDIRALLQSDGVKSQMAMVLPKHLTADRMARVACTAILKTPKLAQCKTESLLQALMLCSQAGLEPDGRNAHLIPYGDIVQVIFDYKGLVSLARRNGIANIAFDIVCENDKFEFFRNCDGLQFKHEIDYRKPRGQMFAAFCIWKDGDQFDGEVMTKEEIDGIRKRSKASGSGPWVTDYNEMAKKTVVRRSSKKWPLDAEIAEAAMVDEVTPPASIAKPLFTAPVVSTLPEISESSEAAPVAEGDDVPMGGATPLAKKEPTPQQELERFVSTESGVSFDDFRSFISTKNISQDSDSWASWDEVPTAVCEILKAQLKTTAELIRKFGKKS